MFRFYRRRDAEISHQVIKLSKRDISIAFLVRPPRMLKTESYQCFLWCYVFSCFPVSINILLEDICVNGHSLICLTEYSNFKTFLGYLSFIFFFPETEFTSCCYLTTFMAHSMFIKKPYRYSILLEKTPALQVWLTWLQIWHRNDPLGAPDREFAFNNSNL